MKTKARDIIPNWPRGTSTAKPYPHFSFFYLPLVGPAHMLRESTRVWSEVKADAEYHQRQAAMMAEWHRTGGEMTSELTKMQSPPLPDRIRWGMTIPFEPLPSFWPAPSIPQEDFDEAARVMERAEAACGADPLVAMTRKEHPTYGGIRRGDDPASFNFTHGYYPPDPAPGKWLEQFFMTPLMPHAGPPRESPRYWLRGLEMPVRGVHDTSPGAAPPSEPLTLEKLDEMVAKTNALMPPKRFPPFYRCHPATYQDILNSMPRADKPDTFVGIRIEQDVDVPIGEILPPKGWPSDGE